MLRNSSSKVSEYQIVSISVIGCIGMEYLHDQNRADQDRIVVVPELGQHVVRNHLNRGRHLAEDLSLTLIIPILHPVGQAGEQVNHLGSKRRVALNGAYIAKGRYDLGWLGHRRFLRR